MMSARCPRKARAWPCSSGTNFEALCLFAAFCIAAYASADMKRFNKVDDPDPILVLGFDAEGRVVELAR